MNKNIRKSKQKRSKNVFFWCAKPLGLRCIKELAEYGVFLSGVGLSSQDTCQWRIKEAVLRRWPSCQIFYDQFELAGSYEYGLCVGFPHKITAKTLAQFEHHAVNLHFAPLPHYRGFGTLEQAIAAGDTRYGVTLHLMDYQLDTGDIIARKWCQLLPDARTRQMIPQLEEMGFALFVEFLPDLLAPCVPAVAQAVLAKQEQVTPRFCTRKQLHQLARLDPLADIESWERCVRALDNGKGLRPYIVSKKGKKLYVSEF